MSDFDYMGNHVFLLGVKYMIQACQDEILVHFDGMLGMRITFASLLHLILHINLHHFTLHHKLHPIL